jgi:hypothetical protein
MIRPMGFEILYQYLPPFMLNYKGEIGVLMLLIWNSGRKYKQLHSPFTDQPYIPDKNILNNSEEDRIKEKSPR